MYAESVHQLVQEWKLKQQLFWPLRFPNHGPMVTEVQKKFKNPRLIRREHFWNGKLAFAAFPAEAEGCTDHGQ